MGRTLCEKIIEAHAASSDDVSEYLRVHIDALLGHDATVSLLIDEFERRKLRIWNLDRVLLTTDHFSPPANIEHAAISRKFLKFVERQKIENLAFEKGICHQVLAEHPLCRPGALIVGADSHTIMGGALGACATGMGSTDILYALATGTAWLLVPKSIHVSITGRLPHNCSGRDVVLELLRILGESGARYHCLELHDNCTPKLSQDDRFAISNMAVEMGAKFALFVPDEITERYLLERDGDASGFVFPDKDATYINHLTLFLDTLTPRIAEPYSPANVVPLSSLPRTSISTAFLGSCSSGRISDLEAAAQELEGNHVYKNVRFIIIPASVAVYKSALKRGYIETFVDAGASVHHPSCGPCGGIDKGILGSEDLCISTSNRNFRGRMGHWDSRTYLASARTVARAALSGFLGCGLYD